MLEIYEGISIFDLLSHYALWHNKTLVYFVNKKFQFLEESKKAEIIAFYRDYLPDDIIEKIEANNHQTIIFDNVDAAILTVSGWFPAIDYLPDSDYYWHTYVIDSGGEFVYENIVTKPKPKESDEGA
jgi:hypothetical protein